jgi:hypothetical protein
MAAFRALGIFCFFGACCALYAAVTLAWPGTVLDALWTVNPTGHEGLLLLGRVGGVAFLGLAVAMVTLGWGWFHRRRWAWYGLVAGISLNMLGDAGQIVVGRWREGLFGVVAAGLVLVYLTRPSTRARFD